MKKNKLNIKKILVIGIVIIIAIILFLVLKNIFNNKAKEKTNLVINNNNVTSRLKKDVIIEDDVIYLSKQDIQNFFDKYIYEDEQYNQIITTSDKKIATIPLDNQNTIEINGAKKQISATVKKDDDTIYLPISEMHDVYDIEITYIKSSNTITIDSLDREQKKAYAAKNISIKSNPKTFSTTVDKVKKGNWLIYVSTDEKGWAKVRTTEGKVGYVKEDKLTNFVTVRDSMEDDSKIDGKVNLVWDYFSEYVKAPDRTGTTIQGINVVSPSFFYIDKNGDFKENVGSQGEEYIEWANSNGYKVWPMVSNSSAGIDVTSKIMNDYESRKELIEEIVDVCVKYKLDGINIDFENMKKEDVDLYSRFIIELTPRIKEIGLAISVDVTAPDGADNWSMCFDRNVIGNVADYIIFMAYDQYGAGSNKAGTTAGYNWVETSLKKFVTTEEIDSDKVILAIPFYTRLWSETEDKVLSKVIDMNEIDETIPDDVERVWNDTLKQYYVEYTDEKYTRKMWIEDINSIKEKLSLIKQYELGGVALWEKDKETDDVWQVIEDALK